MDLGQADINGIVNRYAVDQSPIYSLRRIWEMAEKKDRGDGMKPGNIFSKIPDLVKDEIFETLLKTDHLELERIISSGQATPPGQWYEQSTDE
jgi:hypothetical protein